MFGIKKDSFLCIALRWIGGATLIMSAVLALMFAVFAYTYTADEALEMFAEMWYFLFAVVGGI